MGAGLPQSGNFEFLRGLGPRRVLAFAKKFLFVLAGSRKIGDQGHHKITNRPIVQVRILSKLDGASGEAEQVFSSKWIKANQVGGSRDDS